MPYLLIFVWATLSLWRLALDLCPLASLILVMWPFKMKMVPSSFIRLIRILAYPKWLMCSYFAENFEDMSSEEVKIRSFYAVVRILECRSNGFTRWFLTHFLGAYYFKDTNRRKKMRMRKKVGLGRIRKKKRGEKILTRDVFSFVLCIFLLKVVNHCSSFQLPISKVILLNFIRNW